MQPKEWIFSTLGKGAARPAKHLAIKVASNVTRGLEVAADTSTADAIGNPKATAATVSSFILPIHRHNGLYLRKTQDTKTIMKILLHKCFFFRIEKIRNNKRNLKN